MKDVVERDYLLAASSRRRLKRLAFDASVVELGSGAGV